MDLTRVGTTAAELMEHLTDSLDGGEEIGEVMILVEVSGDDEGGNWTDIFWRCSDPRAWVQHGMLAYALSGHRKVDPDEDDGEDD
jgi:hypothetical protein